MTESIGTARLDIVVDTSNLDAGITKAKRSTEEFGKTSQRTSQQFEQNSKRQVASLEKQIATFGKSREEIIRWRIEQQTSGKVASDLAAKLEQQVKHVNASGKAFNNLGLSAKQTAFAMRGLPAQITDITTSLASGQRPLLVLLQQGGQLKDMFGGIVPAARALGGAVMGLINPYTLAAAAVAAFGFAVKSAAEESDNLNRAIILSGNFARTSAEGLREIGKRSAEATASTVSSATEVAAKVVATGRFTAEQVERVTQAALNMQRVAGVAIEDTIQQFVRLADDPVSAIEQLNKTQNAFASQTRDQVKAFDDQGKAADAAGMAIDDFANTLNNRSRQVEANLSGWTLLWKDVGLGASSAFDEIKRGLTETDVSLKATAANTFSLTSAFSGMFTMALGAFAKLEQARSSASKAAGSFADVIASADTVSGDFARTRGLPEDFGLNVAPPEKAKTGGGGRSRGGSRSSAVRALPDFSKQAAADAARMAEQEDRATEAFKDMAAMLSGPLAQAEREHEKNQARLMELAAASPTAAAGLTDALNKEAAAHQKNVEAIKAEMDPLGQLLGDMQFELGTIGKSNAERAVMIELRRNHIDVMSDEAQAALATARAFETEAASKQRSIDLMDDFRQGAANALTDFATGAKSAKDALKDFFDTLAQQITQAIANQWIDKLFGPKGSDGAGTQGGGWLSAIMGLFSGGSANGNAFMGGQVQAFATGGVVDRTTAFGMSGGRFGIMGEAGPEAILPLHRGPDGKLGVRMAANDDGPKRGDTYIQTSFVLPSTMTPQTQAQIAQGQQRVASRATSRNR